MSNEKENTQITTSPSLSVSNGLSALVSLDAAGIDTLARAKVNEVAEGVTDPAKLFALGQKIALLGTSIVDNVKGYVYGKTYATKGETYTIDGVELTPASLAVKYDYRSSGSPIYDELLEAFETAKKNKEDYEKFLKSIKGSISINHPDTGEVMDIREPNKSETAGYRSKIL